MDDEEVIAELVEAYREAAHDLEAEGVGDAAFAAFLADTEPISFTVTRFAKPTASGPARTTPVLASDQLTALVDLVRTIERAYCRARPGYYPGPCSEVTSDNTKPRSLDLEIKVLADGRFVVKQVREFGGR